MRTGWFLLFFGALELTILGSTCQASPNPAWASVAEAVGTCSAVLLALFLDPLRAYLWPAELKLSLRKSVELGEDREPIDRAEHRTPCWWFNLRVENLRRRVPVRSVRVVITRIEDGAGNRLWDGEIPLSWALRPGEAERTIGPMGFADLCGLYKNRRVQHGLNEGLVLLLQPAGMIPYNFPVQVKAEKPVILTLQARGDVADSNVMRVRIAWDGQWGGEEDARKAHLSVAVVR